VTNDVTNVAINDQVLALLRDDPRMTAARAAERLGLSSRQVQRIVKGWKEKGVLAREGSSKSGRWVVWEATDE
ncbi:MAG: helix-turn-helix domain-containing protein, partial [Bifidobacteriaceae bacterium]|nr:helix-turn-helix domain-containing protein [Bifidobacteriaceae bacterium]